MMPDGAPEGFRPVPSCPGYWASRYGEVYSSLSDRRIFGSPDRYGYLNVNIMVGGQRVKRKMHRLICEAFQGPCPGGSECAHLDGNRTNNHADNLSWVTRSENTRHQLEHGTYSRSNGTRYSDETVAAIRADRDGGALHRELAAKYGLSLGYISRLLAGQYRPREDEADAQTIASRNPK